MSSPPTRPRWESVEWVPSCPVCGAAVDEGPAVVGDAVRPHFSRGHRRLTLPCPDCGAAVIAGPESQWVPRGTTSAEDEE